MKKLLLTGMLCVFILGGCQSVLPKNPVSSPKSEIKATEATETTEETKPEWTQEDDMELNNAYIDIYNYMIGRMEDSIDRYFQYVDYQEEFVLLEDNKDYDCYSLTSTFSEDIDHAYQLVNEKSEKNSLDDAFLQFYPTLTDLVDILSEIYNYTDMKSYYDDNYEKGKEQHGKLWLSLNSYEETAALFDDELQKYQDDRKEDSLRQLQEDGLNTLYAVNIMLDSAQALQEEFYNQGISDGNILDMDMEKIQPLYDEFTKHVDAVIELSKDETALTEEGIPVNSAYWSTFLSSMKDTKVSLTKVLQKVKEGTPLSEFDTMITMEGNCSLSSFESGISSMISDYNQFIKY